MRVRAPQYGRPSPLHPDYQAARNELEQLYSCYDALAILMIPDFDLQHNDRDKIAVLLDYLNTRREGALEVLQEDSIVTRGGLYRYNRPAKIDIDGGVDLAQLAADEVVVSPGLIYKKCPSMDD